MAPNSQQAPLNSAHATGAQQLALLRSTLRTLDALAPPLAARLALALFCTPRRKPLEQRDNAVMAVAEAIVVRHGANVLTGYAWGDGPTVVLVHGWESRASRLSSFVAPLVERGHRVVAFDGPAHGASPGKRTDLVDYSRAVAAALTQYGPAAAVIAHSFGGAATLQSLSASPSANVGRVVLLGSLAELRFVIGGFAQMLGLPARTARGMEQLIARRFGRPLEAYSAAVTAAALTMPCLIVHDRDDQIVPFDHGEAIAGAWAGAKLVATTGLGHRGILRDPAVIAQVVGFVTASSQMR